MAEGSSTREMQPGMRALGLGLSLLLCGTMAKAQEPGQAPALPTETASGVPNAILEFRVPSLEMVAFRGVFNLDSAGMPQHAMLYPAFGLAGFVGSLVAHALIIEMGKQDQRSQAEKDADLVLDSLKPALAGFSNSSLISSAIEQSAFQDRGRVLNPGQPDNGGWVVDSAPIIWVTQDQQSLIADTDLAIRKPGAKNPWKGRIRVISDRISGDDPLTHWLPDSGAPLRLATAKLLGRTFEIGLKYAQTDPKAIDALPFQTVRYTLEGRKKVERAQVLQQGCDYHLLRTLRGDFYAVPTHKLALEEDEPVPDCPLAKPPTAEQNKPPATAT